MDGKRVKRRHHSLRQLAKRALRIGDVTIEAVPNKGQLVVCVSHPEETPVKVTVAIDIPSPNPQNAG